MIRQARRVDYALERAGARLPPGPAREKARYLAYLVLEGEIAPEAAAKAQSGVDFAAVARVDDAIVKERGEDRRYALRHSLPDWLARRFMTQYGNDADALAAALNRRAPLTLRANTLRTTRDALLARLRDGGLEAEPTRFATHGIVLHTRTNVFGLAAFREGLFEAQDEASQLVAELTTPAGARLVVDACAGAGGKTLALGALMGGKGRLVSLDVDGKKLEELRRRARRAGLTSVRAVEIQAQGGFPDEVAALEGKAERVLVDAPCSGIGALRRNPEARWRLAEEDLDRLPAQQLAIARRAARLVAPGGLLVYATCTSMDEENEAVVRGLAAALPGWQRVPVADLLGAARAAEVAQSDGLALAMLPHRHDSDGFYAAAMKRC
jgi:16S rRNA (cytosine967-C5)-methyltransferase